VTVYLDPEVFLGQLTRVGFMVRDPGLFLSALARPQTSLFGADAYPTLALKTAALMDSLVNNHPMMDGNKRSSWFAANLFLELNGFELEAETEDAFGFILRIATNDASLEEAADWISNHMRELPAG
jgi:death-on-curing protein